MLGVSSKELLVSIDRSYHFTCVINSNEAMHAMVCIVSWKIKMYAHAQVERDRTIVLAIGQTAAT